MSGDAIPQTWRDFAQLLPVGIALVDQSGVVRFVNPLLGKLSGYGVDELVGHLIEDVVPSRFRPRHLTLRNSYLDAPRIREISGEGRLALLRKDGTELPVGIALAPIRLHDESFIVAVIRDDTLRRLHVQSLATSELKAIADKVAATAALVESEERFRLAFDGSRAPMIFSDIDDHALAVNEAFCRLTGYSSEDLLGRTSTLYTHPDDLDATARSRQRLVAGQLSSLTLSKRYVTKSGRVLDVEASFSIAPAQDHSTRYVVTSVQDTTDEKRLVEQLARQALHDPLTGLPNRVLFDDRIEQSLVRTYRSGNVGAVFWIDLDDFKEVNDRYGHLIGDALLVGISRRLEIQTKETDTLCRFGGGEFLYLTEGLSSEAEAIEIAERLLSVFALPFIVGDVSVSQRASAGIVTWRGDELSAVELVQSADVALYEAKSRSRGGYVVFDQSMQVRASERFDLGQSLRRSIGTAALSMNYQPIVDLRTMRIVGLEALMRWTPLDQDPVPPSVFIPLAERSDLILDVDAFALRESIAAAARWTLEFPVSTQPFIAVNLSARQFYESSLLTTIQENLALTGLTPDRLVLEITEGTALSNVNETMSVLERLEHLGVGIALDDFGTGYSSLSYLAQMNPRIIKIDQSFVSPQSPSKRNDRLLEAMMSLARDLELTVVAEGIETQSQLERLRSLDCELGQGFLFSRAVEFDEVAKLAERRFDV